MEMEGKNPVMKKKEERQLDVIAIIKTENEASL
jgi:hypothetical protein